MYYYFASVATVPAGTKTRKRKRVVEGNKGHANVLAKKLRMKIKDQCSKANNEGAVSVLYYCNYSNYCFAK